MRTYKWILSIFVLSILISCKGTSEEELKGDWQNRCVFSGAQRAFAATFVIGNDGYVVGGTGGYKALLNDVYKFSHQVGSKDSRGNSKGQWFQLNDFPGRARHHAVGFSLYGLGYVGTGLAWDEEGEQDIRRDFWRYNPADDSWVEVAPLPEKAKARRNAIAFSLKVGTAEYGYVAFGSTGDADRNVFLTDIWRYDPVKNEWTEDISGETKRAGAAVFVINNRAYICNGKNSSTETVTDFSMFDPNASEADRWVSLRTMSNANPDEDYDDDYLGLQRAFGTAYVVWVGSELRGHIVGGNSNGSKNWEYDHNEDLWIQRTQFINNGKLSGREGMISFSFPETGRGYVGLGREGSGSAYRDDIWEFVPLVDDYIYDDNK